MRFATELLHGPLDRDAATGAVSPPIYQTSTFAQPSFDHFGKYDYSRSGNPTRDALEDAIARLEGGSHGFAFATGMAAICSALMIFKPGDHLVVCEDVYGGAFRALTKLFGPWGLDVTFVDATTAENFAAAIRPESVAFYLETPSNPLLKIMDLRAVAAIAKKHGLLTLVDNTFMTPYLQRPLELGCDIVLHSGTKFLNGHSDVVCGLAVVDRDDLAKRLRFVQNGFGAVLGPQDCWLTLRGIRTLKVRMDASQQSAKALATWLTTHPHVTKVHYPGLPDHPGAAIHAAQADGPGAVISFELDSLELTRKLLEGAHLAAFAVSLGGVESIISYPAKMSHAAMPPSERAARGISDTLIRFSVGLEDLADLQEEIAKLIGT